ncbi:glycoside hydrolase family 72 protein [Cucurbitaria berberidis CBS 394.84]|uniref:1,3-beta-glucanosyltransferase n=1 Tax=Cucurbitaria berberidis CBS 394.84 TaxID=1168544 RepID=A0A9P4LCT5_9PLEO|nr:glycoside hydrolase family 72 protein [Cucurbitaria berberidis CBS 394.84]KAF1850013.1 glycoside hydrolase family 72 protein [Cucurbitaria berberidis CBS 394.84]
MVNMFATLLLLVAVPVAFALDFAAARGPYLVNNKTQGAITMNGIWYSLSNSTTDVNAMDSLKNGEACTRDAALMAQLGINTIYVMAIDPKENHDDCFSIFNSVGIYVVVALRKDGIFQMVYEDFANSYTTDFLKGLFEIIDAVKDYENLLGFDLGIMPSIGDFEVGVTLHLQRNDEKIEASELTQSHVYWFSCAIDDNKGDISRADYVSFWNLGYWETDPVGDQNFTYASLGRELSTATVPTWYQMYGVSDEADYVEFELRPELLNDTLYLYNSSSQLIRPNGAFTGGARFTWTNTNIGWKQPKSNWGIVTTGVDGDARLTPNYDRLREIFDQMNTGTWLSGNTIDTNQPPPIGCRASNMKNTTISLDVEDKRTTLTIATDWALPTRPAGLDALITSGINGKRGQMVDVTVTKIVHAVKDSKGNPVTGLALKPSKSQTRSTTSRVSGTGATGLTPTKSPLSTGAKAGIGVGVGVGGFALAALAGLFLLRRRRNKKIARDQIEKGQLSDGADATHATVFGAQKVELATGPEVEKNQAELPADGKLPHEVPAYERYAEFPSIAAEPVELPAVERTLELPAHQDHDGLSAEERRN